MEEARHGAGDPATGEAVKAVAEQVRHEGRRLVDTARTDAIQAAEQRKSDAAHYLSDLSAAAHRSSEELRQKGRKGAASLVDIAAEELDRLGGRVDTRGVDDLWHDFEDLARRRPGLLFGAAMAAGFGAMRFAMSSRRGPAEISAAGAGQAPYGGDSARGDSARKE